MTKACSIKGDLSGAVFILATVPGAGSRVSSVASRSSKESPPTSEISKKPFRREAPTFDQRTMAKHARRRKYLLPLRCSEEEN